MPQVSTDSVSGINAVEATIRGQVISDGGSAITARGVAYGTSANPTITSSYTSDGFGTGSFTSNMYRLSPSTQYYVRAYATNSIGTAYGNEMSFTTTTAPALAIGMSYAGGIIFDLDSSGQHGLVCAPSNQGNYAWGCSGTDIPNTSTAVGTGANNTTYILAGCYQRPIAASACADLVWNGYSDWYLPSLGELQLMYSRLHLQGLGGFVSLWYCSSSQNDLEYAWDVNFSNGSIGNNLGRGAFKSSGGKVRAVRAF